MNPSEQLAMLLCDPEGNISFQGSDEDKRLLDVALTEVENLEVTCNQWKAEAKRQAKLAEEYKSQRDKVRKLAGELHEFITNYVRIHDETGRVEEKLLAIEQRIKKEDCEIEASNEASNVRLRELAGGMWPYVQIWFFGMDRKGKFFHKKWYDDFEQCLTAEGVLK